AHEVEDLARLLLGDVERGQLERAGDRDRKRPRGPALLEGLDGEVAAPGLLEQDLARAEVLALGDELLRRELELAHGRGLVADPSVEIAGGRVLAALAVELDRAVVLARALERARGGEGVLGLEV